jgi:GNAT superfamily N-acetyltransferase
VSLEIRPITLRAACAFIAEHHRHNKPPRGHKFSVSVWNGDTLIGVATAGRPVARYFDDGRTLEVNRSCTAPDHSRMGANSMLYAAIWKAARAMGYRRCITYTQGDETGGSILGAGFRLVKDLEACKGWAESSVTLAGIRDPVGNGGVARKLWEVTCGP